MQQTRFYTADTLLALEASHAALLKALHSARAIIANEWGNRIVTEALERECIEEFDAILAKGDEVQP